MRSGRGGGGGMRPSPYDRAGMGDRYGGPPPVSDRYGPLPPSRSGYYDEYDRREPLRRPLPPPPGGMPMERRPLPPSSLSRDPYARDPYDRYDAYDRMAPPARRTPPPPPMMDRRAPPLGYDRRPDPYADPYREWVYMRRVFDFFFIKSIFNSLGDLIFWSHDS